MKRSVNTIFLLLICFSTFFHWTYAKHQKRLKRSAERRIDLSTGPIIGKTLKTDNGNTGYVYLGIPFAAPPVGDLRFAKTQPVQSWTDPIYCKEFHEGCLSNSSYTKSPQTFISEDCLYLNVFVHPNCSEENPCPVINMIHGGAWYFDSPRMFKPEVLLDNFVSRGVIFVSASYRLGSFGLWNTGTKDAPGNYMFHDMLEAMRWIKREIHLFGGDPNEVTVMGYSSSSMAISALTLTPSAKGLFQRCILMSGTLFDKGFNNYIDTAKEFAIRAGCATAETWVKKNYENITECMKSKDAYKLLGIQRGMDDEGIRFGGPRQDGDVFKKSIQELENNRPKYPYLTGTMMYEGGVPGMAEKGANVSVLQDACGDAIVARGFQHSTTANRLCVKHYNKTYPEPAVAVQRLKDDVDVFIPVYDDAHSMAKRGRKAPTYLYSFEYVKKGMEGFAPFHAQDVFFIFGLHEDLLPFPKDDRDTAITNIILDSFTNFAKYGKPNEEWKKLKHPIGYNYYSFDLPPQNKDKYHYSGIMLWSQLIPMVDTSIPSVQGVINSAINNRIINNGGIGRLSEEKIAEVAQLQEVPAEIEEEDISSIVNDAKIPSVDEYINKMLNDRLIDSIVINRLSKLKLEEAIRLRDSLTKMESKAKKVNSVAADSKIPALHESLNKIINQRLANNNGIGTLSNEDLLKSLNLAEVGGDEVEDEGIIPIAQEKSESTNWRVAFIATLAVSCVVLVVLIGVAFHNSRRKKRSGYTMLE